METLVIEGGRPLAGLVKVSPAKNAVLPIITASLLAESACELEEVPALADVETICAVIRHLGAGVERRGGGLVITPPDRPATEAPYEFVRQMRASFLVMGPLLARAGRARISLPGGCAIGTRPIDLHLKGFALLGAKIAQTGGYIEARASALTGSRIYLDFPSVGATENIIMAAVLARGQTVIENAAEEPEVVDLANYLNAMGARIKGAGTKLIRIQGVEELHGVTHSIIPDRIEAGSFLVAAAITGGDVVVENVICDHLKPVVAKLQEAGITVEERESNIRVAGNGEIRPVDIKTMPYPGFPTDMQPQLMALMTLAKGTSVVTETVFENRFMHVNELKRMGARIKVAGRTAVVYGVRGLTGARVRATDLRAGAALVLAALRAAGETEIGDVHHLDRGYENLIDKLRSLGAAVRREERR
ncbi:UDP-N-acetylglucosamine 1-carboxyvinyltransferase [Desulfotomaculum copahuensis]|uniref:UDP-N-acetylglucosamine 1-carboxyvinyltransferase n=1 Tax=Desulfotomaculum copahuensis TaxID=1838280 RepID=A0A1B7LBJ5_9FIRM|nr:UDP-N-acetylglucosamine 1-carboxyvinyltransferase [Desulfotomaculum copahuensis]OAT79838.1 UDP-N-acetylglucosamine 1-carboxyvinyltransferase [Desulfotomaculum copahuensis]